MLGHARKNNFYLAEEWGEDRDVVTGFVWKKCKKNSATGERIGSPEV